MKKKLLMLTGCSLAALHLMAQDNVGIGNTNPQYRLDLSGRMRIRGGADNNNSAGLWLGGTGANATADKIFMGLQADSSAGFYSNKSNVGWGFLFDGKNGNVGIGIADPSYPLSFKNLSGDKISLFKDLNGNHYGLGIGNAVMQLMTPHNTSDVVFGYGSSSSFTENMRIKGNGNVGIKNPSPNFPLSFQDNAGDKISLFRDLNSNYYGMGIGNSLLQLMTPNSTSDIVFGFGKSAAFTENMRIKGNGNIGIGVSDPVFALDISNRMRIRAKPGSTAGIWLNNEANTAVPAFIGMQDNNKVGFYGSGNGWGLTMNTQNGALSVAGSTGDAGQILTSKGDAASPEWKTAGNIIRTEFSGLVSPSYLLSGATFTELTGSAYTVTIASPSRVILYNKTQTGASCAFVNCETRWRLEVFLNGTLARTYRINGAKNDALSFYDNNLDLTTGPEYFDLPAGTHQFTFFATNLIGSSWVGLQVTSMIIPL